MRMKAAILALVVALPAVPAVAGQLGLAERQAVRRACSADFEALCPDVQRGNGRLMQCVRAHQSQLSAGCADALTAAGASLPGGADNSPYDTD